MKPRRGLRRLLALGGLAAVLAALPACPHRIARPADGPTEPAPILARLAERSRALRSLSGMMSLEVWRDDERVRLRQLLLVERPNRLRVDTLSPFDQPLTMMASDGETVTIYSLEQRRFERGPATVEHLARLLRLPLTGEELTSFLAGGVPIPPGVTPRLDWDDQAGAWVLELGDAGTERGPPQGRHQRVLLDPQAYRVVEIRTWQDDRLIFLARFGDYDGVEATSIPRRMHFEVPAEKLRVDARFEDHTVNVSPPPDAFTIPVPRGIPVDPL